MPVPVALFVYNRPEHTKATLEALARNTLAYQTDLVVFSDGAKDPEGQKQVEGIRSLLHFLVYRNDVLAQMRDDQRNASAS
jgi:hypothetical protein